MYPLLVDLARVPALLVGDGPAAARRLAQLDEAGATRLRIFSASPDPALIALAGPRLERRLPTAQEIAAARLLFIADLAVEAAERLAALAGAAGVLVHAEDRPALCDLNTPALVRRGDLLVTVSTNGRSPTLARRLRQFLEQVLTAEWAHRVARVGALRDRLRTAGASLSAVGRASESLIDDERWLPPLRAAAQREASASRFSQSRNSSTLGSRALVSGQTR
jgi:precorrin-2 dehydrogenase/sirohydrochlorin ferrochelatase